MIKISLENCRHVSNSRVFMSDNFEANRIFIIDKLRVKIDKKVLRGSWI